MLIMTLTMKRWYINHALYVGDDDAINNDVLLTHRMCGNDDDNDRCNGSDFTFY